MANITKAEADFLSSRSKQYVRRERPTILHGNEIEATNNVADYADVCLNSRFVDALHGVVVGLVSFALHHNELIGGLLDIFWKKTDLRKIITSRFRRSMLQ